MSGRIALRFPHRFENARLRNPTEIIADGRGPAGGRHVEIDGAGQRVGMGETPGAAGVRVVHGVDAEGGAMREQCRLAVDIERHQGVPEIVLVPGQLLCPLLMARFDRLGRGAVGQSRRLGC